MGILRNDSSDIFPPRNEQVLKRLGLYNYASREIVKRGKSRFASMILLRRNFKSPQNSVRGQRPITGGKQ
jgi:hypothetical protein